MAPLPPPLDWPRSPTCVVGGTGFLGLQIVHALRWRGAPVRVFALPAAADHPLRSLPGVELVAGDVRDPEAVAAAVAGCRVVFQASGPVVVGGHDATALESHAAGTRALVGVLPAGTRLVHTSSVVTVGATRDRSLLSEGDPFPLGRLDVGYVRAKRAAEAEALAAAERGADVVVTNPGHLFGPDDFGGSVMGRFCVKVWKGRMPIAPPGGVNAVDVRDAAEGHVLAAERGVAGTRYILGGTNVSYRELVGRLLQAAGSRPVWCPTAPGWAFAGLAAAAEVNSRFTGKAPYPSWEHARMGRLYWYHSSARAVLGLGYRPRLLARTLADAFAWHAGRTTLAPRGVNRLLLRPAA